MSLLLVTVYIIIASHIQSIQSEWVIIITSHSGDTPVRLDRRKVRLVKSIYLVNVVLSKKV